MFQDITRREFGQLALASLGLGLTGVRETFAKIRVQLPGIKLGSAAPAEPSNEDLLFFRQLGVDCVFCAVPPQLYSVEGMLQIKKRYADAGIAVHNLRNLGVTNNQIDIVLGRPAREQNIEEYKKWLRMLGQAGFHYTISNFNCAQIVTSSLEETRGAKTRFFDLNAPQMGILDASGSISKMGAADSRFFGREYTADEIWANFSYFVRQVAPVAEEAGIVIGFHPDDPPGPPLFGVPRILSSLDDYRKALKIARSPNVGVCFCCGTWAEGGAGMGADPAGAIRWFGERKLIYEVHFRNVSATMPRFQETYVDNGYYDMFKAMKALVEVKYNGIVHLDHPVPMVGGGRTYEAFAMGYMRAMRQRALAAA